MSWEGILQMGFSFFVAVYLLVAVNNTINHLRDAIMNLSHEVKELRSLLQHGRNAKERENG
jgi:heme exporter protein D